MSRLPKVQPPADPAARRQVREASELARDGDMKAAQQALREAVASGALVSAAQRQVMAWWSAEQYDIPGFEAESVKPEGSGEEQSAMQLAKPAPVAKNPPPTKPPDEYESAVAMLMRRERWSRKKAEEFIADGGLEAEQMQAEMSMQSPMDEAFDKLKAAGPPQWFIDAFAKQAEDVERLESGEGGQAAPGEPQQVSAERIALEEQLKHMAAGMAAGMAADMPMATGPPAACSPPLGSGMD